MNPHNFDVAEKDKEKCPFFQKKKKKEKKALNEVGGCPFISMG